MATTQPAAHALLSASGSKQWIACPPSARLSEQFADTSGVAAAEGTLAHLLAELLLKKALGIYKGKGYTDQLKAIQGNPLYTPAMLDHIEGYAARVLESYAEAKVEIPDAHIYLEERLDFSAFVEEGFGTGDVIIISDKKLRFRDLKFGKGVPVSAINNSQMMLYALGALHEFGFMFNIEEIEMIIDQPRLDSVSTWTITVAELNEWAEFILKPAAALAFAGEGNFSPSEDTCRFCRARGVCKANADFNLKMAEYEFKTALLLSDEEISSILARATQFTNWLKGVTDHAFDQALNHDKKWPGFKLVEGRSNRKYVDEDDVATTLQKNGYKMVELYQEPKLLGITAMEKMITKSKFDTLLNGLIMKAPGAPTLVPEADKRPELNSAAKDFSIMETEE